MQPAFVMMWLVVCLLSYLLLGVQGDGIPKPTSALTNTNDTDSPLKHQSVSFYVMGDGPYGSKGRERFPAQLERLENRPEFVIHVGDVHERQQNCNLQHYDTAADAILTHVHVPTFVIPGDADWYECNDKTAAWQKWTSRFLTFHENWPNHYSSFDVWHQEERPENFSFTHKGVLFVGFHVLDATVDDWDSWNELVHDNAVWLKEQFEEYAQDVAAVVLFGHAYPHSRRYKEFYDELLLQANAVPDKPILYIHGDSHGFVVDHKLPASNILRMAVDMTRESDPTQVTVHTFARIPFKINRRPLV